MTQRPMDAGVLEKLKNKADYVPWKKEGRQLVYALYSFAGFSKTLQKMAQVDQHLHLFNLASIDPLE